ncbi:MAG: thiamine pyrophosphate-dependent enzyme [Gemmataceae bacterium]|nr:thiamine pyrophosphate-dependent enzyme [Gemmataceae bacterium]
MLKSCTLKPFLPLAAEAELDRLRSLYRVMVTARWLDQVERELVRSGEAFFHVPCSGHEGVAVLHRHITPADWLHLHYRDKALLLARGIPPEMFFHALLCNAASHSAGRQMSAHMSDPERHILSLVGPVGNNALQAVGVASVVRDQPGQPLVVCSMGDGTTQQGEVLEAIAEAVRSELPVLFWIEDNGYSISTVTHGQTFYSRPHPDSRPADFYGLPIHRLDGRDVVACDWRLGPIVDEIRSSRRPALVVFEVERLASHTNADDERVYRSEPELRTIRQTGDPLRILANHLLAAGVPQGELDAVEASVHAEVRAAAAAALQGESPQPALDAKKSLPACLTEPAHEYRGDGREPRLTLLEALREVLRHHLAADARVTLFGEDIEDPKGDVFGVTRGLTRAFPGRVRNSPLSESTIVGLSIGRALAGARPVAFLQFADFLPLAFNQIATELGSMDWRTNGGWQCPVILMIACGGYRPGLGPFHAQTFEATVAHVPGVDVFMPSNAADAAGLLNAAFASGRPTLFFYPKVCLNDRETTTSADAAQQLVPVGRGCFLARGDDLTLVTWGSTISLCKKAAEALAVAGVGCDLLDLRSLSPWDRAAVAGSVARTGKLLVVHEDNLTCGFGAEVAAAVVESASGPVTVRRVARPDTYIPCNFANQLAILPSFERILSTAAEMLGLDLTWQRLPGPEAGLVDVEAVGSSPADQTVTVVAWHVRAGQTVSAGDLLAELEADKAALELTAPVAGTVEKLLVPSEQGVRVGTPLVRIRTEAVGSRAPRRGGTPVDPGQPILRRRPRSPAHLVCPLTDSIPTPAARSAVVVGLSSVYTAEGSLTVGNNELGRAFPGRTAEQILRLTGIESRRRLALHETALTLAADAARHALHGERLDITDLDAIVCSTSTPLAIAPSMACLLLHELCQGRTPHEIPAHDVLAACTGYLYALATAFDFLQTRPDARVLVVTAEAMSRTVDPTDFDTAILFGDAATATVLYGPAGMAHARARLHRPVLSAKGENGCALKVAAPGCGHVEMDGRKVFSEAVRQMPAVLERACTQAGLSVGDLSLIVPHQANGRILEAVRSRLGLPEDRVVNRIRYRGNTSSSSIPLCLADLWAEGAAPDTLGLCAFGGGFTFGAAILEMNGRTEGEQAHLLHGFR